MLRTLLVELGGLSTPEAAGITLHSARHSLVAWAASLGHWTEAQLASLSHWRSLELPRHYAGEHAVGIARGIRSRVIERIRSGWQPATAPLDLAALEERLEAGLLTELQAPAPAADPAPAVAEEPASPPRSRSPRPPGLVAGAQCTRSVRPPTTRPHPRSVAPSRPPS